MAFICTFQSGCIGIKFECIGINVCMKTFFMHERHFACLNCNRFLNNWNTQSDKWRKCYPENPMILGNEKRLHSSNWLNEMPCTFCTEQCSCVFDPHHKWTNKFGNKTGVSNSIYENISAINTN